MKLIKKYMIRCDIEGVSGVVSYRQTEPGQAEYEFGLRMFKADLLACIHGLLAGGADEIEIYDEHFYGRNIDPTWLPDRVSAICGKPPYRADWAGGLDASYTGLILLGFHSKFGTLGGLLHHSYELDIQNLRLNGTSVGEIGMETSIAGDFDVPLLMITADSAGCHEAEELVPGVKTVPVKDSLGETGGRCHPLHITTHWIHEAAKVVASGGVTTKPWKQDSKVILEIALNPGPYADLISREYAPDINTNGELVLHGATATAVWADYWQRKLHCQKLAY